MTLQEWFEYYQVEFRFDPSAAPDETFQLISVLDDTILYTCAMTSLDGDTTFDKAIHLRHRGKLGEIDLRDYFGPACWRDFIALGPVVQH